MTQIENINFIDIEGVDDSSGTEVLIIKPVNKEIDLNLEKLCKVGSIKDSLNFEIFEIYENK